MLSKHSESNEQKEAKMMRIIERYFISAVVFFIVALFSIEAGAERRIGILTFSEEIRYKEAARGILDKLKEAGYGAPQTKFIIENAGANKAKAAELVERFAAANLDLIFTLGSSATLPVSREIKDVPIVFSVVYDPVDAGIAKNWESSGNNTTGTSTKLPMSKLMDCLKDFAPVKRLAVMYSPGEKNSETQLKDIKALEAMYGIKVIPVPLTNKEEVAQILPEVIRTSDAMYITGSNLVDRELSKVVDMATTAKIVTITHLEDLVGQGVLLGVTSNSYQGGRLAGEKAIKIFKGAKPSSIPIEPLKQFDLIINMKTARAGQFTIPPSFMSKVTKKIE
jgi:putative ABC transport system substrate-binding protein